MSGWGWLRLRATTAWGWRLTPAANANAPDISFGVRATRRESDTAMPEHTVGFEAVARW